MRNQLHRLLLMMAVSYIGFGSPPVSASELTYAEVISWSEVTSTDNIHEFARSLSTRGIEDWPECWSRLKAEQIGGEIALLHDICRGNALSILRVLKAGYETVALDGTSDGYETINVLLDFREHLISQPSYISLVLAYSIETYCLVEVVQDAFNTWSADFALETLTRLNDRPWDTELIGAMVERETGREVYRKAVDFVAPIVEQILATVEKSMNDSSDLDIEAYERFEKEYRTFWTVAILERHPDTAPKDIELKYRDVYEELMGEVPGLSSLSILSRRTIGGLMFLIARQDYRVRVSAALFLEFMDKSARPTADPTVSNIEEVLGNEKTIFNLFESYFERGPFYPVVHMYQKTSTNEIRSLGKRLLGFLNIARQSK